MQFLRLFWFILKGFCKAIFTSLFVGKKQKTQQIAKNMPNLRIKSKRKREQLKKLQQAQLDAKAKSEAEASRQKAKEEPKADVKTDTKNDIKTDTKASQQQTPALAKQAKKPIVNNETIDELESVLLASDLDYLIVEGLLAKIKNLDTKEAKIASLQKELARIINPFEARFDPSKTSAPHITLVFGVNGSGKTTSIGKLAYKYAKEGKKVLLIACDTFRAAASEQLKEWSIKAGCQIEYQTKEAEDPAAVCFRGLQRAKDENFDIVIIDTSGRQQTNANLMDELKKIERIVKKHFPEAPHESLLVLDGSSGMGAVRQVEAFLNFVSITGLVITKLDGTAKGGGLFSIAKKYKKNIYFACSGESLGDIEDFNAAKFLRAIV